MSDAGRKRGTISLRLGLLLIFVLGSVGLGAELLLLGPFRGVAATGAPGVAGSGDRPGGRAGRVTGETVVLRLFRLTMLAYVLGGIAGFWFHIGANMDFELEMYSRLSGWDLVSRTARGALPVLAPGALIQLGLIGYLYTHRHSCTGPWITRERLTPSSESSVHSSPPESTGLTVDGP